MIKVIDVDKLFDEYISGYVYKNIGKVKPEEIENKIPQLYVEFGDKKLKELDGKTPNTYYKSFSGEELLECLKLHVTGGIPVSDFLCEALTLNPDYQDALISALDDESSEEFTVYVMNIIKDNGANKVKGRYLKYILWDYSEIIRELATETLIDFADDVKEDILSQFKDADESKKIYLTEILANTKMVAGDDRVFDILVAEFVKNQDAVPIYAGYLSKYGDDRAIPFLTAAIEREKISYADFEELRFAIEALGGEYNKTRDFSKDKSYKKIKATTKSEN